MSVFLKIFLSVVTVTVLSFSVCGHIIIDSEFHSNLNNEFEKSKTENLSLRSALATAVYNQPHNGDISLSDLKKVTSNIKVSTSYGDLQFALRDENYELIGCSDNVVMLDEDRVMSLENESQLTTVYCDSDNYYSVTIVKTTIDGKKLFLENYAKITNVFEQKDRLYSVLQILLPSMTLVIGGMIFIFSKLITDPIKKLSSTEMEFAQGDFSKRVEIKGNDEVSKLSENFNFMADKIEDNIKELKDAVKRLADMAVLIKNVSTYQKTKPVYDAYRKARNREKYRAGQEQAIILHEAAARSLKAAGIAKLPNLAALQSEYEALQAQKEALYADYGKLKKKVREYDIIKQNIDSILQADRQPEREKGTERG